MFEFDLKSLKERFSFSSEETKEKALSLFDILSGKYDFIGAGRNRAVFKLRSGNYVIKVPLNEYGFLDNGREASVVSNKKDLEDDDIKYPQTRYVEYDEIPCVVMEYVSPIENNEEYQKNKKWWFDYVDCRQVGFTRKGEIVAFDYGVN